VQGRARVRRADRDALESLLSPLADHAAAFDIVGLTARVVEDADVVVISTATAPNSAWIAAGKAVSTTSSFPSLPYRLAAAVINHLVALATGESSATAAAMRPGARLVWLVHESGAVMRALGPGASTAAVDALSDPRSRVNRVVFVSNAARLWWIEQLRAAGAVTASAWEQLVLHWGVPRWKLDYLSDPGRSADARKRLRAQLGFDETDFVFLVVGSFHPMKGHAGIVRAFVDTQKTCINLTPSRRIRLVAVGGGLGAADYFPRMFVDAADILAIDGVRLLPTTSDVGAYLAMADAFVSNTQCEGETWGLATLEALAAGKPVLAAGVGGALEQLEHNTTALLHASTCYDDYAGDNHRGSGARTASVEGLLAFSDVTAPSRLAGHMCAVATDAALAGRLSAAGSAHVVRTLGQAHIESALIGALLR
jgi:glycosyltransferase involved in cell wall biosynthesis